MHILIFAGGAGTRLWPLSRRNSPKQFAELKDHRSTLQMAVERVEEFGMDHIFIATQEQYVPLVEKNVPGITKDAIFTEPARRDTAAAVLLALLRLKQRGVSGVISMLWSDHFMERPEVFRSALKHAETLLEKNASRIVFLGERPRFANEQLGWIETGTETDEQALRFISWKYHPAKEACEKMFKSGEWFWNPGYYISTIDFFISLYQTLQPELYQKMSSFINDEALLAREYPRLPALSFDVEILEKVAPKQAIVLPVNMGWSDPGTLYALKEAIAGSGKENYTQGSVVTQNTHDSFVYNEEKHKLITTIGLEGMIVVNTGDALIVCAKDRAGEMKPLLERLEKEGLEAYL